MRVRIGKWIVLAGLLTVSLALGLPVSGLAQNAGDPPGRVGRLAQISGTVSFHSADENQWGPATLNFPITSGNSLWTEPRSHAAVDVGSSRIYMDSSTELDIATLDDQSFIASLPQGAAYLRVYNGSGQYEIDTPRGQVQLVQSGDYEIVAGDSDHPTTVTVFEGAARLSGPGVNLALGPQQSAIISGQGNQLQASTGQAAPPDDFIRFVQDEERPYQNQLSQPAPQYGSPEMTGYQDLNRYGSWQSSPDYGQVWYPQVAAGWAPYRYGHWAYVWPWGWTWVDDAPWGFAPFHYGRWVDYGGRWGWAPGRYERAPIYAPALVAFFGDFGGISIGISIGSAVGWVPLGYDEVYYPGYRVSRDYLNRMNVTYVRNTTIINYNYYNSPHGDDYSHYRNHQHGATLVPGDAMLHSRPIDQAWKQIPQASSSQPWQHAKPYGGQAPIKPDLATAGFNQGVAHKAGIAPTGQPNRPVTPGPKIQSDAGGQGQGTGGGKSLKNQGAPGPTIVPSTGTGQQNVQPGTGGQGQGTGSQGQGTGSQGQGTGGQGQGTGGGKNLKNQGAPGPTIVPSTGTGQQNVQPGTGGQGQGTEGQGQGTGNGKNLKNQGAPGPTIVPSTGTGQQNVQPGTGGQGQGTGSQGQGTGGQGQGTGGGKNLKNQGAPGPTIVPSTGTGQQNVQPGTGGQGQGTEGQGQGTGNGKNLKNQGAPGPTIVPSTGPGQQNVQPGTGDQKTKCAPGDTTCKP